MASIVSLRNISKTYSLSKGRTLTALHEVDLDVQRGDFIVITGRSGSGKTTLLNLAAGLARPTTGTVEHDGGDLWAMSDAEQSRLRNRRMGFVFQFPSLLPQLSTLQNVTLPLEFGDGDADGRQGSAEELLELVGLGQRLDSFPRELSAGQQQRVVIARALISSPDLLFADEPSSDLDEDTENEIMSLFARVHRERGVTIVMVTHTRQLVTFGTRHVQITDGRVQEEVAAAASS
jgi:ABC-type lipoprotein export system ATPase subunit